jgi:Tfp pilus assembly protein FimV
VLPLPEVPGRTPLVRIQTAAIVDEPVVTITLTAGCAGKITRNFTLLADPPDYVAPGRTTVLAQPAPACRGGLRACGCGRTWGDGCQPPPQAHSARGCAQRPAQAEARVVAPKASRKTPPRAAKPALPAATEPHRAW